MEAKDAKRFVEEIRRQKLLDDESISGFLISKNVSSTADKLEIFKAMAEDLDLSFDLDFLKPHLLEVAADTDEFVDLLITLSQKKGGNSLSTLAEMYARSPETAIGVYERLTRKSGELIIVPVANILKGIGLKDPDRLCEMVDFSSNDTNLIRSQIEALRVLSFEQRIDKSKIQQIMRQIESPDMNVRFGALNFLLTAQIRDTQIDMQISNKLVELASSTDIRIQSYIGRECFKMSHRKPEVVFKIVNILATSEDPEFLDDMTMSLASVAPRFPTECLEIVQRWWKTDAIRNNVRLCDVLQAIAKGDANKVNGFLCSWIAKENNAILRLEFATLLRDMFYGTHKTLLLDLLVSTDLNDERQLKVVCRTVNEVLTDLGNFPQRPDEDFVANCFNFVSALAKSKGINVAKIEPGAKNTLIKILAIVDSIQKPKRNVDFLAVNNNLERFPYIKYLLNQRKWFGRAIIRKDASHPLMSLLEMKKAYDSAMLKYIDNALALVLREKNPGLKSLGNGFETASQFFSTVGELVVCAHFKSSFETTVIQYGDDTRDKVPDCKVEIDGTDILVEMKSPELLTELKYSSIKADIKHNKLKDVIKKTLDEQIHAIAAATKTPIFIAVNISEAIDIDEIIDIEALFLGSMQFELVRNLQGQTMGVFPSRAKDSITQEPKYKLISGIIICYTEFDPTDHQMKLRGTIYKNLGADRKVDDQIIEKIKNSIFDTSLPDDIGSK
jgi:hypothetical protein